MFSGVGPACFGTACRLRLPILANLLVVVCLTLPALASPIRVATLGGESSLLLDTTNLFRYPSLARTFAHADVELFDAWALAVVPVGDAGAIGLAFNRPTPSLQRLRAYTATAGSDNFRALTPTPWFDAVASTRLGPDLHLGAAISLAYDRQVQGEAVAKAARWRALVGASLGVGRSLGVDATIHLDRFALRDDDGTTDLRHSDDGGFGLDVRGRWQIHHGTFILPWVKWERSRAGLAPVRRQHTVARAGAAVNARLQPSVMIVGGVVVGIDEEEIEVAGQRQQRRRMQLPLTIAGAEVQSGALTFRVGLRHQVMWQDADSGDVEQSDFGTSLTSNVGLGLEFGDLAIDGLLEKDWLRDGPYFLAGSRDTGGLFANLSITYRLFPSLHR